jgi:hypothetical protein
MFLVLFKLVVINTGGNHELILRIHIGTASSTNLILAPGELPAQQSGSALWHLGKDHW